VRNGTFWAEYPTIPKRPITTWEIWNEPNLAGFCGGKPSAKGMAQLTASECFRSGGRSW
jgi:hypothetical protein